jgi:hypothetical protein
MPGELTVCLHAVFGGRQFVCVHSVQSNTVCPCAVSGGTLFAYVCVCVCAVSGGYITCVCSVSGTSHVCCVWWYKVCACTVSDGTSLVCVWLGGGGCSVHWYKVCVQCAGSDGTSCIK